MTSLSQPSDKNLQYLIRRKAYLKTSRKVEQRFTTKAKNRREYQKKSTVALMIVSFCPS